MLIQCRKQIMKMEKKICLITGANAGIGRATALGLAELGATLILACRNKKEGEETIKELSEISQTNKHKLLLVNLQDFNSIRKCVDEFKVHFKKLDVLINNAGAFFTELDFTNNNIERQFAVNHLAPFLLTHLLIDSLLKSESGRIINLSSSSHYWGKIYFDDLYFENNKYKGLRVYEQSKLANVLFTYRLAILLKKTGITVNCVDPGGVNTHIGNKNSSGMYKFLWNLKKPLLISPKKGASTSIYLASSNKVSCITGKYFFKCNPKKSSKRSYNKSLSKRLWHLSEELVDIKTSNYII